ncbi:MAG: phosphodiesterase [Clostridia bacterium]|nr:phosphodiesterase [Clostridia bacterium]
MKYLIASDLHGSEYYASKIVEIFKKEKADKLILLGDIYNHGPRNPLPENYSPMQVADVLNGIKDSLIVIKGNCDSQVDTMISEFDFIEHLCIATQDKTLFITHGHVYNKDNLPKTKFDAIIYGHFHTGFIEKQGEVVVANAGSLSLPKNQTPNSYILLDQTTLILKDLDGKIIKEQTI